MRSLWYCIQCSKEQWVRQDEVSPPCKRCGCKNMSAQPKLHSFSRWSMTTEDVIFLRTQGIDPEDDYEEFIL